MNEQCKHCGGNVRKPSWSNKRQRYQHHKTCQPCQEFKAKFKFTLTKEDRAKLNSKPYCNICGTVEDLVIDHCHKTNEVRGYLCRLHNTAIAFLGDDLEGVIRAVNYLSPKL